MYTLLAVPLYKYNVDWKQEKRSFLLLLSRLTWQHIKPATVSHKLINTLELSFHTSFSTTLVFEKYNTLDSYKSGVTFGTYSWRIPTYCSCATVQVTFQKFSCTDHLLVKRTYSYIRRVKAVCLSLGKKPQKNSICSVTNSPSSNQSWFGTELMLSFSRQT